LRNVIKFFAHLLYSDSIGWNALECIKLKVDTTSSSREFNKNLFHELAELMGIKELNTRLMDPTFQEHFASSLSAKQFSINFLISIGLDHLAIKLDKEDDTPDDEIPSSQPPLEKMTIKRKEYKKKGNAKNSQDKSRPLNS
jgi:pre-mRNA-splicing factor CWC22